MIVTIIIIILMTGGCLSRFYLKNSLLDSFVQLMASIIGVLVAFTYYEPVAALVINKGFIVQSAHGWCLFIIYAITTVIVAVICDQIVGSNIDLGNGAKIAAAIVCGLLVGLMASGVLIASFGMDPPSVMSYNRFDETIILKNPKKPIIPVDSLVTGLYAWMADGAMGSKKKFSLYHTDLLDQIHINRHRTKEGAALVAGKGTISIPRNGVKIVDYDGQAITMARVKIKNSKIPNGGATDKKGNIAITPGQFRLVCQKKRPDGSFSGDIKVLYPVTYRVATKNKFHKKVSDLGELIALERNSFVNKMAPVDLTFEVPSGITARYLQFRNNVMIEVPGPATEEELKENDPFAKNG
ncbi:MAG: hypothetical protein FVQ79_07090 [Planctomycetes bacterium]|nr:hypothetical protein [Planctomycetota bacterium]